MTIHCLKQWWLVYWRIYSSLGLNELRSCNIIIIRPTVYQQKLSPLNNLFARTPCSSTRYDSHWSDGCVHVCWVKPRLMRTGHTFYMMTLSNGNIFPITDHLMRSFDAFFDLRLNKRLSKLEQLERLRGYLRIPPAAWWLPMLLSHIGSQVKRR